MYYTNYQVVFTILPFVDLFQLPSVTAIRFYAFVPGRKWALRSCESENRKHHNLPSTPGWKFCRRREQLLRRRL